jgi:fructose-specific phosphotransferase system IIC component
MDVSKYSKAIAAAVAGLVVGWLFKHNVIISDDLQDGVEILLSGVITSVFVYLAPKNRG